MDNPTSTEPTSLNVDSAAAAFADILEPREQEQTQESEAASEPVAEEAQAEPETETEEAPEEDDPLVTVKIDGKEVEIPLSELKNGYQRQADYTRKTQEASETRKAAESERQAALAERQAYAMNLQKMQAQLEGAIEQQANIDWQSLLENDPVEYLKQQHLYQQRQAAYQQNIAQQAQLAEMAKAEQAEQQSRYLAQQREDLLAKLPEWRDESKAAAEKQAIAKFLQEAGFENELIQSIQDHRHVIIARKAMLYDQMMSKAQAAAKKVAAAPQRVVKPGQGEAPKIDGRSSAMQRLGKSGRVEDAAAVFANLL